MSNYMGRLNDMLFDELERLSDIDTNDADALKMEMGRARAMQGVAREINSSTRIIVDTAKLKAEYGGARVNLRELGA